MQIRSVFDSLNLAHLLHIPRRNEAKGDLQPDRVNEKKISRSHLSHLRSALVLVAVFGVGWIWGLLVIDRKRSSAEPPDDGRLVFFPNPVGSLKLEFHLVYLALRAGVS